MKRLRELFTNEDPENTFNSEDDYGSDVETFSFNALSSHNGKSP